MSNAVIFACLLLFFGPQPWCSVVVTLGSAFRNYPKQCSGGLLLMMLGANMQLNNSLLLFQSHIKVNFTKRVYQVDSSSSLSFSCTLISPEPLFSLVQKELEGLSEVLVLPLILLSPCSPGHWAKCSSQVGSKLHCPLLSQGA